MKIRALLFLLLVMVLAGCTDDVNSVTREYRNTTNESIDALMMVTSDAQANAVLIRVFKPLSERFRALDRKLDILRVNRTKKEFAKEVLESDGAHMYFTEIEINRQRYALEMTRLKTLMKHYADKERELNAQADPNQPANGQSLSPALFDLLNVDSNIGPLRDQLKTPKLIEMMAQISDWKVEDYDKIYQTFVKKRKIFRAQKEIQLVN